MNRYERLCALLKAKFPDAEVRLFDDSADHAGHAGAHGGAGAHAATDGTGASAHGFAGETHYRLQITDAGFSGLTPIKIHREILAAVKPETEAGMHSFVIERATAKQ